MKRMEESVRKPTLWSMFLVMTVASIWVTGFTPDKLPTLGEFWFSVQYFFPPAWEVMPDVIGGMAETIGIAFLGTLLAFVFAFPISFVTARGIGHPAIGSLLRWLMAVLRSIPEFVWAIIFIITIDLGSPAGVFALMAHNVGILTKLIGELFEEAPLGTQEAIASTGAGKGHVVWFGILPWAMPGILSHTFFRFECNIRTAAVLGTVGAGGIGRMLMEHRALFMYDALTVDVIGIVILVVAADWLGTFIRRQVA